MPNQTAKITCQRSIWLLLEKVMKLEKPKNLKKTPFISITNTFQRIIIYQKFELRIPDLLVPRKKLHTLQSNRLNEK